MVGHYTASRSTPSTFLSLLDLPGQVVVTQTANGALMIDAFRALNGQPKQWQEIAPFLWREIGGTERLAAKVEGGRVTMFSVDGLSPFNVFLPVAWWRSSAWLMPSLIVSLTILLLTVGAWPAMAVVRRHYGVPFPLSGNAAHAHLLIRVAGVATLADVHRVGGDRRAGGDEPRILFVAARPMALDSAHHERRGVREHRRYRALERVADVDGEANMVRQIMERVTRYGVPDNSLGGGRVQAYSRSTPTCDSSPLVTNWSARFRLGSPLRARRG